jgi:hypothetical protein
VIRTVRRAMARSFNLRGLAAMLILIGTFGASLTAAAPASADTNPKVVGIGQANAEPSLANARGASEMKASMTIRCTVDPQTVTEGQNLQDLCNKANSKVGPLNTVPGNCGYSYLYVYPYARGVALFSVGAHATPAPIAYGSASIHWDNLSVGASGNFSLAVLPNSGPYDWTRQEDWPTGSGVVFGAMTGDVFLSNGRICSINHPSDTDHVN